MRVFHLSAECYPVAKVGGLADVVGALPKYQNQLGWQAAVVMPYYDRKFVHENEFDIVFAASTLLGTRRLFFEILKEKTDKLGFELYLVRIPGLIDRTEVYQYPEPRLTRKSFYRKLQLLLRKVFDYCRNSGHVSARPIEAGDQP